MRNRLLQHLVRSPLNLLSLPNNMSLDIQTLCHPPPLLFLKKRGPEGLPWRMEWALPANLIKFKLTSSEKNSMITGLTSGSPVYDSFLTCISRMDYDIVIDGANVLYSHQGKKTRVGYWRLNQLIQVLLNLGWHPLLILHQRHSFTLPSNCLLYQTPVGLDDDTFLIVSALVKSPHTPIVSNDRFRDYIYLLIDKTSPLNYMEQFEKEFRISYFFSNQRLQLIYPDPMCSLVQDLPDGFYIPVGQVWLQIPKFII